jgi:hypothetical protein
MPRAYLKCTDSWTLTLPAAATVGAGFTIMVRNAGTGAITLAPSGVETIDDLTTQSLLRFRSAILFSDGTNWASFGFSSFANGRQHLANGDASFPAITFPTDTNTGIFRPAADQLAVSTGGLSRLLVTSTAISALTHLDGETGAFKAAAGDAPLTCALTGAVNDAEDAPAARANLHLTNTGSTGLRGLGASPGC